MWAFLCVLATLLFLYCAQRAALKRKAPTEVAAEPEVAVAPLARKASATPGPKDAPQAGEIWRLNRDSDDPWPGKVIEAFVVDSTDTWVRYSLNKEGKYPSSIEIKRFVEIFSKVSP